MLLRWSCGEERCEIRTLCASAMGVIRLTHGIHTRHNIFCRWRSQSSRLDGKLLCTRRALMDTKIYRKSFDVKDSSPKCQSQRASPVWRVLWCWPREDIGTLVRNLHKVIESREEFVSALECLKFLPETRNSQENRDELTANKFRTSIGVVYHLIRLASAALWHN